MKNEVKKEYWETLYNLNYADISAPENDELNIPKDELPEDMIMYSDGKYIKCTQNLSNDKIQIFNQIKAQKTLENIESRLKVIGTYIAIVFWISVVCGVFGLLALMINLL